MPGGSRVTPGDVLTLAELNHLRRPSNIRGAGLVAHAWLTIGAAMAVYAAWPSALTLAAAVAVIGSRQLGLFVLMHDASHWLLFRHHGANSGAVKWLCAYPIGADLSAYRRIHHQHHRRTQQPDDPELGVAGEFPVARTRLWLDALGDLGGWTAARMAGRPWREPAAAWRRLRGPLVTNAALFGVLAGAGHWYLYPLLWLLPLATWYRLVSRLRSIAEHAMVSDPDDPLRNSRTTAVGPLGRVFLAPYWVNYHLEHHLLVFVPCWKLRRAHALLLGRGYGGRMERAPGYLDVIRRATRIPAAPGVP